MRVITRTARLHAARWPRVRRARHLRLSPEVPLQCGLVAAPRRTLQEIATRRPRKRGHLRPAAPRTACATRTPCRYYRAGCRACARQRSRHHPVITGWFLSSAACGRTTRNRSRKGDQESALKRAHLRPAAPRTQRASALLAHTTERVSAHSARTRSRHRQLSLAVPLQWRPLAATARGTGLEKATRRRAGKPALHLRPAAPRRGR